jgi:uncharacterized protein YbaP (TraB family)
MSDLAGRASRALAIAFAALLFGAAAPAPAPAPELKFPARAHPAFWTVHGPKATIYLLGSIHVLPPQIQWRTPEIDAALNKSDVFVFEIPMDASQQAIIQQFVKKNGMLPAGTTLPSLLDRDAQKDYTAVLNLTHMPPEQVMPMRPWLALLVLNVHMVVQQKLSIDQGLDRQVYAIALKKGASIRAFETPEQQLRLLMPDDQTLEIEEFDAGLKEMLNETMSVNDLIDAWATGNASKLNDLMNSGFKDNPKAEEALFEDRNRNWVAQLESMANEKHIFFVTVGAGHLAGPKGVPALLRADGYKVDGP